jgi:hypothetical protein
LQIAIAETVTKLELANDIVSIYLWMCSSNYLPTIPQFLKFCQHFTLLDQFEPNFAEMMFMDLSTKVYNSVLILQTNCCHSYGQFLVLIGWNLFKSSPMKLIGQLEPNFVGMMFGKFSIEIILHFIMILQKHGHHWHFLVLIGWNFEILLLWYYNLSDL